MKTVLLSALLATGLIATPVIAAPATTPAPAATAPAAATHFSTAETDIGTILDTPAARAILDKHLPGMSSNANIDMARSMTLKMVQQYKPDDITDARLAAIDADFAAINTPK